MTHKTPVDGCPGAVCAFKGRLLAGVGSALRVYEFGKKKLLRKAECGGFPNFVTTVHAAGDRAYVGASPRAFSLFGTTRATVQCSSPPTTLARGT